jgi:hypothetical protein
MFDGSIHPQIMGMVFEKLAVLRYSGCTSQTTVHDNLTGSKDEDLKAWAENEECASLATL